MSPHVRRPLVSIVCPGDNEAACLEKNLKRLTITSSRSPPAGSRFSSSMTQP
jgi:hypothetical protein